MGHRLSKIYTRTGDAGTTSLGDGTRVAKDTPRIEAYGCIDELNSQLGVVLAHDIPVGPRACLSAIQHMLFDLGGELAVPGMHKISKDHIDWMERTLDHFNAEMPYLQEFILPGGNLPAAHCHVARTVCRRCERIIVSLSRESELSPAVLGFLNRLSDLLFVFCRVLARTDGGAEVQWETGRPLPKFPPHKIE